MRSLRLKRYAENARERGHPLWADTIKALCNEVDRLKGLIVMSKATLEQVEAYLDTTKMTLESMQRHK